MLLSSPTIDESEENNYNKNRSIIRFLGNVKPVIIVYFITKYFKLPEELRGYFSIVRSNPRLYLLSYRQQNSDCIL
jgi:hypothetical protein